MTQHFQPSSKGLLRDGGEKLKRRPRKTLRKPPRLLEIECMRYMEFALAHVLINTSGYNNTVIYTLFPWNKENAYMWKNLPYIHAALTQEFGTPFPFTHPSTFYCYRSAFPHPLSESGNLCWEFILYV